ncbi:MAG: heme exporter protein CcmD [Rhodospirillales bacterium]|nr:heme exporter protein CcmD [Rhodospirillales bacterium]
MEGIGNFLSMGGYAGFIWPAFGISALVLAGLLIDSRRRLAARERELAALGGDRGQNP